MVYLIIRPTFTSMSLPVLLRIRDVRSAPDLFCMALGIEAKGEDQICIPFEVYARAFVQ